MKARFLILLPVLVLAACSKDSKTQQPDGACDANAVNAYNQILIEYTDNNRSALNRAVAIQAACRQLSGIVGAGSCTALRNGAEFQVATSEPLASSICAEAEVTISKSKGNNRSGARRGGDSTRPTEQQPAPKPVGPAVQPVDSRAIKNLTPITLTVVNEDEATDLFDSAYIQGGKLIRNKANLKRDTDYCSVEGSHISQTLLQGDVLYILKVKQTGNRVSLQLSDDLGRIECLRPNNNDMTVQHLKKALSGPFKLKFK